MRDVLTLVSGVAWTLVYVECVRRGFRQRTYLMPAVPLALNFSWECVYAIHGLAGTIGLQDVIEVVWAVADLLIVVTFLRFGRAEQSGPLSRSRFGVWSVLLFAVGFAVQLLVVDEFGWHDGSRISAFLMNVFMSLAFLAFTVTRPGGRGQSVLIAVSKCVGTLAATAVFGVLEHATFILGLGIACAVLDLLYVVSLSADKNQSRVQLTGDAPSRSLVATAP